MENNNNNNNMTSQSTTGGQPTKTDLSQQATEVKEAVKHTMAETTANVTQQVKQQTQQVVAETQHAVSELAADAKHLAAEKLDEAKTRAESVVDERKNQTADRLQGIAGALRETSNQLHEQEEETFATYAATAAEQVDKVSGYLRNQDMGALLHDAEDLAHRQPELFVAGALAAGFMLGRFFKSSAAGRDRNSIQRYGYYPRTGQSAEHIYGTAPQQSQYGAPGYGSSYDAAGYAQPSVSRPGTQTGGSNQWDQSRAPIASGQKRSGLAPADATVSQSATQNQSSQYTAGSPSHSSPSTPVSKGAKEE